MEPKIRFKGFEGEWKTLPITEIASLKAGKSFNKLDAVDTPTTGYYPCYGGNGQRGYLPYYNQNGKYNIIGRQGALCGCVNVAEGKFYATEHAVIVTPITITDFEFLHESLVRANINQYATGAAQPGISVTNVNSQLSLNYPLYEEQKAIGKYFTSLDSQISASTSRLTSLKQMKAASLQAMFPQEGETVPKVRFKGFEGEWKNLKIGDIAPLQRGYDLPTHNVIKGSIPVVYSNGILRFHNIGKCQAPAIVTGRSGTIGKFTYIDQGEYWPHNTSLWVTSFNNNYPRFIYYLFQNVGFEKYATGSGVPTLNRNDIHKHIISIPSDIEEQRAIANYFTSLDHQITLQTQRLEKLKQIKSACLDKMFV